ncbi:hypothetical protein [Vallitalea sp.]|uniref:hypothetical protein n=1 Tax=Vallitalea sp. TaxID=1882829 RepID=UPI0025D2A342|nr:hypothetical protein [Vallitalea sp.]MCT4685823.1 hypothetical protein [Vallitalea sp.]
MKYLSIIVIICSMLPITNINAQDSSSSTQSSILKTDVTIVDLETTTNQLTLESNGYSTFILLELKKITSMTHFILLQAILNMYNLDMVTIVQDLLVFAGTYQDKLH